MPGKNNYLADFLSRYQIDRATLYVNEEQVLDNSNINFEYTLPQPQTLALNHITLDELNENQLQDIEDFLRQQSDPNNIDSEIDYSLPSSLQINQFTVIDDKLKVIKDNRLITVLNRDDFTALARSVHNKHHGSIRVTDHLVLLTAWSPDHLIIITNIVRSCSHCQVRASFHHVNREFTPLEPLPCFSRWGLDFIGPINQGEGPRYALNAIEYVSGLMYSFPCHSPNADTAINLVKLILQVHLKPSTIVCDNGAAFVSQKFLTWCQDHHIRVNYSSSYHPIANGKIEKANGLLKKIIIGLTNSDLSKWQEVLHVAVNIYNLTPSVFNFSPYYLAMGITTSVNEFSQQLARSFERDETTDEDSIDTITLRLYEIDSMLLSRDDHTDLKMRRSAWINTMKKPFQKPAKFLKGDWVYRKKAKKSNKSDPNYDGPYQIIEVHDKDNYNILDSNGNVIKTTVHHDDLKYSYAFDDSPIVALSNYKNALRDIEQKLLDKISHEIGNHFVTLEEIHKNRIKIDTHNI